MTDRTHDEGRSGRPDKDHLPRRWLPEALPAADDHYWDEYTARIMTTLEPTLAGRGGGEAPEPARGSWVAEIGSRLSAAALLAAAAVAMLLAVGAREEARPYVDYRTDDLALALFAFEGNPAPLLEHLGIPADPMLVLLTFQRGPR